MHWLDTARSSMHTYKIVHSGYVGLVFENRINLDFCNLWLNYLISNMTGCHQGPNRKLQAGYRAQSQCQGAMCRHSYFCLLDVLHCNACHIFHCRVWHRVTSLCYACIYDVQTSSSPPGYLCAKFLFFCGPHCQCNFRFDLLFSFSLSFPVIFSF